MTSGPSLVPNPLTHWSNIPRPVGRYRVPTALPTTATLIQAASEVKREKKILVIIGNPPYNAFAGTSPEEEGGLVDAYKEGLTTPVKQGGWGIKKFNMDDLYVRFFRIAERRIAKSGKGVVCYISNFSYLSDPSFAVMRQRFLSEFDKLWFDCMNGDSRETGKQTPDGKPDPSVFSTDQTTIGIRVGTAICLMIRKERRARTPAVRYRDHWGTSKRRELLSSLEIKSFDRKYESAFPLRENRYSFRPSAASQEYLSWPKILEFSAQEPFNGPIERRGNSMIAIDRNELDAIEQYLNPNVPDELIQQIQPAFMKSSGEFKALKARLMLKGGIAFNPNRIAHYPFKPFDTRFAYLDAALQPLFSRPSPKLLDQRFEGNAFLITRDTADKDIEGPPFYYSPLVCDYDCISGHARHFPIRLRASEYFESAGGGSAGGFFVSEDFGPPITANLSITSREYLKKLGIKNVDSEHKSAALIWMHALAIGYSPKYLNQNADGVRQDWPRIPLPTKKKGLIDSAVLGEKIASLLESEKSVVGVTSGKIETRLRELGVIYKVGGGAINPKLGEIDLTAGWGHGGQGGVCMPGQGKIREHVKQGKAKGDGLGEKALDIYLNDVAYWSNVPQVVWEYRIGGYQVIKKWLSYREKTMLGRGLTMEEAEYVTEMVRRIAALILMQPELDSNYEAVKAETWAWPVG